MTDPEKKDVEVYVNFSPPEGEDIIEEEVVNSPAQNETANSPLEKLQARLPPEFAEFIDNVKASYEKHKKYYLIGAVVIGILLLLAIVGALFYFSSTGSSEGGFDYGSAHIVTYIAGPITLRPGEEQDFHLKKIERPSGDISLLQMTMQIINEYNITLASQTVYNNNMFILNQQSHFVAGRGEEEQFALHLPRPYVVLVEQDDTWDLRGNLINIWGLVSNATVDAYVKYEVVYTDEKNDVDTPVGWMLIGSDEPYDIPGTGGPGSVFSRQSQITWTKNNATLVVAQAHVHIGCRNITLQVGDTIVTAGVPTYNLATGYMESIPATYPGYEISKGDVLTVTAYYDNSRPYIGVMGMFRAWTTLLPDGPVFVSATPSPTPTAKPAKSPKPSPSASSSAIAAPEKSVTIDPSIEPSETMSGSASISSSPSASTIPSESNSVTPSSTESADPTSTPSTTTTPTLTHSPSGTPTVSPSSTSTQSESGTGTPSLSPSSSPSTTASVDATRTPTATSAPSQSTEPLPTPSETSGPLPVEDSD